MQSLILSKNIDHNEVVRLREKIMKMTSGDLELDFHKTVSANSSILALMIELIELYSVNSHTLRFCKLPVFLNSLIKAYRVEEVVVPHVIT